MPTALRDTYLLEVSPYDAATGSTVDVRRTTAKKWNTGGADTPANVIYQPGFTVQGFGSSIVDFDAGLLGGLLDSRSGEILIPNSKIASLDAWLRYSWIDRPFTIYKVAKGAAHAARTVELKGYVTGATLGQKQVRLTIESFNGRLARKKVSAQKFWGRKHGLNFVAASTSHRVNCGDNCDLTGSFTLEALVRISSAQASAAFLQKGTGATGFELSTGGTIGTELTVAVRNGSTSQLASGPAGTLNIGTWSWITGVLDTVADTLTLYKDGKQVAQTTGVTITAPNNANVLMFGANPSATGRWLDGDIAEIRIWNVARTQQEINANLYGGLNGVPSGLIGWWRFAEGTGAALADETTTNADGTITGATWIGTYEGEEDVAGHRKPWAIGEVYYAEPVCIDAEKLIYACCVRGFSAGTFDPVAYDGGAVLGQDSPPTSSDLFNETPNPGKFMRDDVLGLIRLGSTPEFRLSVTFESADFVSDSTAFAPYSIPCIVQESGEFSGSDVSITGSDIGGTALRSGLYVRDGEMTCAEAIAKILHSYRGWGGFQDDGIFRAKDLAAATVSNTPSMTLTANDVRDLVVIGIIPPVKEILFGYRPYWPPHATNEIAGAVPVSAKNDLMRGIRQILVRQPTDRYGRGFEAYGDEARQLVLECLLNGAWHASYFTAAIFAAHDTFGPIWQVKALNENKRPNVGDVVLLQHPRLGLAGGGVECIVVGRSKNIAGSRTHCVLQLMDATTLAA